MRFFKRDTNIKRSGRFTSLSLSMLSVTAAAMLLVTPTQAQDAQAEKDAPADVTVPAVEVIQETPKPKKKKVAKKKKTTPSPTPAAAPATDLVVSPQDVDPGSMIKMSPLGGSEIPITKVPNAVATTSSADFANTPTGTPQNVLQSRVPGVIITDVQGNDFKFNVQYRGFESSPVNGVAQGLAVYQNGVRINESFGDVVNFDLIPSNAISDMTIMSGNPVFGLNAIGGAINLNMRNGFNYQGVELDFSGGSHNRLWGKATGGMQSDSGVFAGFVAVEGIEEDGWRDFSRSKIQRMYADVGFKTSDAEFHLNYTGAETLVGVVTASPVELLDYQWTRTFTSPQETESKLAMFSLNGTVQATETLSLSGVGYYRNFRQNVVDGNLAEFEACAPNLCIDGDILQGPNGDVLITDVGGDEGLGSIDRINQDAESYGGSLQAVSKTKIFDRPNQFLFGATVDHGEVQYTANSEPGLIGDKFVVAGAGFTLTGPDDIAPRDLTTTNDYYGLYFSNTLDLTNKLAVTVGGRYNYAEIEISDNTGDAPELNGVNKYERFNPMAGATYQIFTGLTAYGSYAEANRAPTAAELACSNPENPCLIESFLTDDPPLEQVITTTWEAGFRGEILNIGGANKVKWSLGYFHALNEDDIISIAAPEAGRGYFQNAGNTKREGIEASIAYYSSNLSLYANYNYVKATYEDPFIVAAENNPNASNCPTAGYDPGAQCIYVSSGDRLPGIPEHKFKAGFNYLVTQEWMVGADLIATSDTVFVGDEANVSRKLAGYERVDLRTTYNITDKVQIYGFVENLLDKQYGLFGTFFDTEESNEAAEAAGLGDDFFSDPRSITPAKPVSAYIGIKIKLD